MTSATLGLVSAVPFGKTSGRDGLVAAVDAHHQLRGGFVALDVDLGVLDALALQLRLQARAESAPGRGVHRQHVGATPRRGTPFPELSVPAGKMPGMVDADAVLRGLDPEQQAAAQAVRGPVCILAGAGTGKTRAITHRIAYQVRTGAVPPGQLLAVTFTARAAGELRTRLRNLGAHGVQARTFHAAALRQLQYFAPRVLGGAMPDVVDNALRIVGNSAARLRLRVDRAELRDLAAEIDWAKAVLAGPETYPERARAAGRDVPMTPDTVANVYAEYEQSKRRAGVVDFSDLLMIMAGAIEEYRDVAEEIRARYRHFVVDEYQDVSPLQQRLLDAWLGGRDDLCVVGDANQTIYSFAGASPEHLLGFRRRFPDAVVVRLERDYRSTPQVVGLANRLVKSGGTADLTLIGQRRRRAGADVRRARRRTCRGRLGGSGMPPVDRRGHPGRRDRGAVPHQRAVRGVRAGARRRAGAVRPARRRAVLRPPRDP